MLQYMEMHPITQASLEKWCNAVIAECDGHTEGNTVEDILKALGKTIEQLSDVYIEDIYQGNYVKVPAGSFWCRVQGLASSGDGYYSIAKIDAYQDKEGNIYGDIDALC